MVQPKKTLNASTHGIQSIKAVIKTQKYTKNDCKSPVSDANKYELRRYIIEKFKNNNQDSKISMEMDDINKLLDLLNSRDVHIFAGSTTTETSKEKARNYLQELKPPIELNDLIEDLVTENKVHLNGLSYRNWQKFYEGKRIPEDVFIVFCQVLDLDPNEIVCKQDNTTELEDRLKLFNHKKQIGLLSEYVENNKNAFLISNDCLCSRSWMLHRLEKAIETDLNVNKINKCLVIPLNGSSSNTFSPLTKTIADFKSKFHQYKIYDKLKNHHIVMVINIDYYCYDINNIQEIYDKFFKIMYEARSPKNPGHLLMFLLATDKNLQNQLQNCSYFHKNIMELPKAKYESDDLRHLLCMEESIANEIINKCQNNAQELLIEIYKHLKVDRENINLQKWKNYPWN